ncbi:DnaJ-class molecular chaperone [Bradyrhizobium japonicum]
MLAELKGRARAEARPETRKLFNAKRKALQVMGLNVDATLGDIKARYRAMVKRHHPDANGGDRSTEQRLVEIIKAYHYLKTVVRES